MTTKEAREMRRISAIMDVGLVQDAPCVECGGAVEWMFARMVGTDKCMCVDCSDRLERTSQQQESRNGPTHSEHQQSFARRLERTGLHDQKLIQRVLGMTTDNTQPRLKRGPRWARALGATEDFQRNPPLGGLMVLAGPTGVGKSTCAAWLVWMTGGRFVSKSEWNHWAVWRDTSEILWLEGHPGVVALDEVCPTTPSGRTVDTTAAIAVVETIVKTRHDRDLLTVLTTNASESDFLHLYGTVASAIWRRAHDLAGVNRGGWIDCFTPGPDHDDR